MGKHSIPKIIHYCWFGGNPMPELLVHCMESWKEFCPEYEIKCWTEDNFDCNENRYIREAYQQERWGFISDAARLSILYHESGVYLDTDVELIKPIDDLLNNQGFIGFEKGLPTLGIGVVGALPGAAWIKMLLDVYADRPFLREDGCPDITVNTKLATEQLVAKLGLVCNGEMQLLDGGVRIYPWDYFYPLDYKGENLEQTENTHCIHYYSGMWKSKANRQYDALQKKLQVIFGARISSKLAYIYIGFQKHGVKDSLKIIKRRFLR